MDAGLDISYALAANWLPWLCMAMLGLVWISCVLQPRYLHGLVNNSFSAFDVNAAERIPSIGSQICQWAFNVAIPAIGIYIIVAQDADYTAMLFARIMVAAIIIDCLRMLVAFLVQYTFRLDKIFGLLYMRYYSIRSIYTFIMMALILCVMHSATPFMWLIVMAVNMLVFMVLTGLQWGRLIGFSLTSCVGLLIYLITIELLPMFVLYGAAEQMYMQQ